MFSQKIYQIICLFLLIMFFSGCSSLTTEEKPKKVFSIYALADKGRSEKMQTVLPYKTSSNKEIFLDVQRFPILSAERIVHIEPVGFGENDYDLKLFLDNHGKVKWEAFSALHNGDKVVLVVDGEVAGICFCNLYRRDSEYAYIAADFSKEMAENVSKEANLNYKKFNKKSWLGFLDEEINN